MAAGGVLVGRGYVSIRPEFEGDWSNQVNARASRAGKGGGAAFSKAFGVGLKGIGALAGVAVAANLNAAAAGAAVLAPALATAGAAAGALKLGLSGVGDAFKAAFSDSAASANSAASATKAVEGAQRGLANAQRALAQARVDAAERVRDAQRGVADAERDLADAQRDARDVQKDLNTARQEATRTLEDMNLRLEQSRLDEEDAVLRLTDAQRELAAAQESPGVTPEQLAKLQLAYDKAALNLKEQRTETSRLASDTKAANKAGVEGSQQVLSAKQKISDADRTVADKERALADAQADVTKARVDGQRQIADAQRAVSDAAAAVADAQAAAAAQTSALDTAMSKLAPNARSFVTAVQGLGPAWKDMRLSVQNALFSGLDSTVTRLGRTTIPVLKEGLTATAGVWNQIAKSAASGVTEMAKSGVLKQILAGATANLAVFKDTPKQVLTAFGQLSVAAQPAFNKLLTQFAGAITSFTDGLAKSFASGGLEQAITTAFGILSQFGTLLGNVLGVVSQIFKAASDAGGQIVGVLGQVFGELRKVLATDEMQAQMRQLFASIAQIVGAIVPVIGAVVQAIVPLAAAIAQPVAELAVVLGPVLTQLATTLGAALMPVLQALLPALVEVGTAIVEVVRAAMPLLLPIANLIGTVIGALAPALTPIIAVVTQLVGLLVGPLTQVVQAMTPALTTIAEIIAQVFTALQPLLAPIVVLLGQVAQVLAGVFGTILGQLMAVLKPLIKVGLQLINTVFAALAPLLPVIGQYLGMLGDTLVTILPSLSGVAAAGVALVKALTPLIPLGVQLVTTILQALMPVLPAIAGAFGVLAGALAQIVGPLAAMTAALVGALAPILTNLIPVLGDFIGLLADTLASVLPPLATALVTLVAAFAPLLPVVGDLARILLQTAGSVLKQLLPSLMQLVTASVQLAVALLPLIPPLAQLAGLVVRLAVGVLNWLLPPLVQFAGFLVTQFASALSGAIGWLTSIISVAGQFATVLVGTGLAVVNWFKGPFVTFFTKTVPAAFQSVLTWVKVNWPWILGALGGPVGLATVAIIKNWDKVKSGLWSAWDWMKKNVFSPMGTFFTVTVPGWGTTLKDKIVAAFDLARSGIKTAWDKIKAITKAPVQFVVDTVYNDGIRKVWNLVTDAFGGKHLAEMKFADGGITPGFTPGRDVHTFLSPTGGKLSLSGGEAIMRPEFTRGVGSGFVDYFNQIARSKGVAGVRQAMAVMAGGGQAFKDGGIFSGIGDALSGAWDKVKSGADWLKDTFTGAIQAGVSRVVNPLIGKIPGGDIGFVGLLKDLMKGAVKALTGAGGKADAKLTPHVDYKASAGVEQWRPVVVQALREVGQSAGLANTTLRRMNQESGGNPTIVNKWDSNWQAGHPSVGLMQVIGPTFRSYAGKYKSKGPFSYGVSVDPLANVYASMKYALGSYGSLSRAYDRPGGYDSGGWLGSGQMGVNNLRQPEAVLTPSQWRTMTSLAAGTGGGASRFEGDLYLDSGEWLGRVRGEAQQVMQQGQRELMAVINAT
ncbi:transglycosylase SLT domain-containing protein [Streptomyces sp. ID05-04B]|uniref:transglycosylase SLT domain-containing protein n=1 Tax=Streptomyces sp. ID05-04B TaxID=3028661 RepID=UPI0029C40C0B|nr:transglycosylase SLT domain-containing protein [Streptomyces sp. ID05-04B]MDX5566913.1 transglycosylase SLT domain-containing protein [Streptomyces sp. ID05-04B]